MPTEPAGQATKQEPENTDQLLERAVARHEWVTDQLKQLRADRDTLSKRIKALAEEEVITARSVRINKKNPRK